jgi:putative addiction module component (TIGR02574 family)
MLETDMDISIDELRRLPIPERLELLADLWDSIAADASELQLTPSQAEELDRRLAAHEAAPSEGVSWPELRAELKKGR